MYLLIMSRFVIEGSASLSGSIPVYGSKNAALPLLTASLLTREEVTLHNVPPILDVKRLVEIITAMGADVEYADTTVRIQAKELSPANIPQNLVGTLRGSILLLGALLGRYHQAKVPLPGGDIIGARPIDTHLDGFRQLGAVVTETDSNVSINGSNMKAGTVVLQEFSVTATENILMTCATLPGKSTIHIAAAEPHVVALCQMLSAMGAKIEGAGSHTITIEGSETLSGTAAHNIYDMIEAGTFMLLAAATRSALTVEHVPVDDLLLFFKKLDDIGISYTIGTRSADGTAAVRISPATLSSFLVQTLPHPGIATDLQAPFSVIATQVTGSSLIHDPMYEGRFKYIHELQKMGADAVMCDPHRVIITGPTKLRGRHIPSLDIRSGVTLVMAGLVAEGQTIIEEAEHIDRGYAHFLERLQSIGAPIKREEN